MQLPELNTSGVDVSNTLAKINAMRTGDLQRQNLQSEIDARKEQAPVLNALKVMEMKKAEQETSKAQLDEAAKSTAYIAGLPVENQEAAWTDYRNTVAEKGINLPVADVFKTNGTWDPEKYKKLSEAGIQARNLQLDPGVGKAEWLTIVNDKFDPSKEESETNPRMVEKRYVSKGYGKIELDPTAPIKPAVSTDSKDVREEKRAIETSKHNIAVENETIRHNQEMEKIGANAEKRAIETERHNKAIERIMVMNAQTNRTRADKVQVPKVRQTVKNAAGDMLHVMTDGTVKILGLDGEGQPAWITATAEQTKGVTGLGGAGKKGGRFSGIVSGESSKTLKPVTKDILNTFAATGKYKTKQEVLDAAKKEGYDTKGF